MRKLNIFLVTGILITLIAHSIMGGLRMSGANVDSLQVIARISATFIIAHMIVSGVLTAKTLRARRLSGAGYFRENGMFWARRISGLTIIIPLIMHLVIFMQVSSDDAAFRLKEFGTARLISQIFLVAAIALHVLINIRPFLISLGIKEYRAFKIDIMIVLSVLLLLFGIAFVIYYLRWIRF